MLDSLLEIVRSDLAYLYDEWDEDITDDSLRRSSPVLRRFLVHGDLLRAWRRVGFDDQPQIIAPTLEEHLKRVPTEDINFATAGGAVHKGVTVAALCVRRSKPIFAEEMKIIKELSALGPVVEKKHRLMEFVESPCIIVKGAAFARRELIQYVANKLGGAHYDETRDAKLILLDDALKTTRVADKNSVYYELLSIGQGLARAPDIQVLRRKLSE